MLFTTERNLKLKLTKRYNANKTGKVKIDYIWKIHLKVNICQHLRRLLFADDSYGLGANYQIEESIVRDGYAQLEVEVKNIILSNKYW